MSRPAPAEERPSKSSAPPRALVLGVGNLLRGDDGFGVHLIASLADTPLPEDVRILEAGTVSHELIPLLSELEHLIVIDAVEANDRPGAVFLFSPDDIPFACERLVSLHQIGLIDVLRLAGLTGRSPRTVIIGVQPKDVSSWSLALSDEVREAMPKVRELVLGELKKANLL